MTAQVVDRVSPLAIDEDAYRELYPDHVSLEPTQDELHAEWRTLWHKTQRAPICIVRNRAYEKRIKPRVRYSQGEIDTIIQLYPEHGATACYDALGGPGSGRTVVAIRKMANDLGLHRR